MFAWLLIRQEPQKTWKRYEQWTWVKMLNITYPSKLVGKVSTNTWCFDIWICGTFPGEMYDRIRFRPGSKRGARVDESPDTELHFFQPLVQYQEHTYFYFTKTWNLKILCMIIVVSIEIRNLGPQKDATKAHENLSRANEMQKKLFLEIKPLVKLYQWWILSNWYVFADVCSVCLSFLSTSMRLSKKVHPPVQTIPSP